MEEQAAELSDPGEHVQRETIIVPVLAETARVSKRQVETGGVRIRKTVQERQETVDVPLIEEDLDIERVPVDLIVASPPAVRYEGDTIIVPVLEEVFVVEKRLRIKEELRIRRRRTETHSPQQVTLRREEVTVEPLTDQEPDFHLET